MAKPKAARKTKPKAKKDPNAPKKPSGAYIWFCNDHRAKIKGEHSNWGVAEIGKELGALWKTLDDDDKKKYFAQADKDKIRYQEALEKYNETKKDEPEDEDEEEEAPKKEKPKRKRAPPKKKAVSEDEADDVVEDEDEDDDEDDE